jgi:hypothetical protein
MLVVAVAQPVDLVPDSDTAIKIAEVIGTRLYGKTITIERPFQARLEGQVWVVQGTLPKGFRGGVMTIKIARKDGRVLFVMHDK